jgi:hypothetical protein
MTEKLTRAKPRIQPDVARIQLPKAILKRLGTLPDSELSRRTGLSEGQLKRCRDTLGIATFSRLNALRSNRRALAIIKSTTVRGAARELGVSRTVIQKVRNDLGFGPAPPADRPRIVAFPKALISQLGKTYDAVLARRHDIPRTTVRSERQRRGIPAMPNDKGRDRIELPARILKRLGKESDNRLAKESGHSPKTIAQRRNELGIPRYRPA